jgi:hypothetical protein
MWKFFEPIAALAWFFSFLIVDAAIYYTLGGHLSPVPLIICLIIFVAGAMLTVLAEYQLFKHRNDKEHW